jgi:hypothetical protein
MKIEGMRQVLVVPGTDSITIEYDGNGMERIGATLRKLGYPEVDTSNNLYLKAKSYGSCMLGRILHH